MEHRWARVLVLGGEHITKGSQKVCTLLNRKWVVGGEIPPHSSPLATYAME